MSDVLIKGMKLPKSCDECWMTYEGDSDNCPVVNESVVKYMVEEKRHPSCPLVEVRPYGRMIDADNLINDFKKYMCGKCYVTNRAGVACEDCFYRDIEKTIAIAPTVLEASE